MKVFLLFLPQIKFMAFRKFETFVAHKLLKGRKSGRNIRPVVLISVLAISLSSAVMIITASVIRGFKEEISEKVIGFGSHITISHFESQNSYETRPILRNQDVLDLAGTENIKSVSAFVSKPAILKNGAFNRANVLKGVDGSFDLNFFKANLTSGNVPKFDSSNEILISQSTADALDLNTGDDILVYFIQDPPRIRKLSVCGIYSSGFGQFDELMAVTNMNVLQVINGWGKDQISGYEVLVRDYNKLEKSSYYLYGEIPHHLDTKTIQEKHPDIFNWLELQDVNYGIILGLMIIVAAINAISALLILILEKTSTIGILKSIGCDNGTIRRIFILQGTYLLLTGLILGNVIGLGCAFIQETFEFITLPEESYYLSAVPIKVNWLDITLINASTIALCVVSLIIPSHIISGIQVIKVLKFD